MLTFIFVVLKADPPGCLDTLELEDQINNSEKEIKLKFFELVLQIRQKLVDKYK